MPAAALDLLARYDAPSIKWGKRVPFEGIGGMEISTLHVGTQLDAPNHFITNARGIGELPMRGQAAFCRFAAFV